jgi:hypothetical protein
MREVPCNVEFIELITLASVNRLSASLWQHLILDIWNA